MQSRELRQGLSLPRRGLPPTPGQVRDALCHAGASREALVQAPAPRGPLLALQSSLGMNSLMTAQIGPGGVSQQVLGEALLPSMSFFMDTVSESRC